MSKKDYIAIAEVLNRRMYRAGVSLDVLRPLISDLCEVFRQDNPNFNRAKFEQAVYKHEA